MSYIGTIQNGVIVLPPGVNLPEGSEVVVTPREPAAEPEPRELTPEEDPFLATVLRLAKPRPHWPADYSLNHGHYIDGEPKRS